METKRAARIVLPIIISMVIIAVLYINASVSYTATPHPQNGVLNLEEWNKKGAFAIVGQWEFYWGRALTGAQIESGLEDFEIIEAPGEWNYYETELGELPGFGLATYRIRVICAQPGTKYGLREQNQASAYRLYADGELIGQNGAFGDKADAPVSNYRPQLGYFTAETDSFDVILQISNDAYAVGGMWEPLIFGTHEQIARFDSMLSGVGIFSFGGLAFICLFFIIFYTAQRREKDMLTLVGIGLLVLLRLTICGSAFITYLVPGMPISGFGWIEYLALLWVQFFLLYFVYSAYGTIVPKWQVTAVFAYAATVSLCVMALPFEAVTSVYMLLNIFLLLVILAVTVQLGRAAWQGRHGASALFGAMAFVLLLDVYWMFYEDWSVFFYLLANSAIEYMGLFFVQCIILASRYNRAQKVEMSFLKGQIHPHFIHNSLTGIASSARIDPVRTRELLLNMSSCLRGFYDYDSSDMITLKEELTLVRAYVNIEQMRFGTGVEITYDIESENLLLPPLILQPLVENALVHGLREKDEGGAVTVYAKRTNRGKAKIGVRDNGPGLSAKTSTLGRHGVGIENINHRLARIYRTQLVFAVPEGGGCEVYIEIPWKEAAVTDESISG